MLHSSVATYSLNEQGLSDGTDVLGREEYFGVAWTTLNREPQAIVFTGASDQVEIAQMQLMPDMPDLSPGLSIEEMTVALEASRSPGQVDHDMYAILVDHLTPTCIEAVNSCLAGTGTLRAVIHSLFEADRRIQGSGLTRAA